MKLEMLAPGAVRFFSKVEGEERGPFFGVMFVIECTHEQDHTFVANEFEISLAVPAESRDEPYSAVEDRAARLLPSFFRDLADVIEQDIARSDQERAAEKSA